MGCMHGGSLHWHPSLLTKSQLFEVLCYCDAQTLVDMRGRPQGNPLSGQSSLFKTSLLRWCVAFPSHSSLNSSCLQSALESGSTCSDT